MFLTIFKDAQDNQSIPGLQDLSYSYNQMFPNMEELHKFPDMCQCTSQLFDDWIISGSTRWTPIEPSLNGYWRQHDSILAIFAACNLMMQRWLLNDSSTGCRHTPRKWVDQRTTHKDASTGFTRGFAPNISAAVEGMCLLLLISTQSLIHPLRYFDLKDL